MNSKIILALAATVIFTACRTDQVDGYDRETAYIYFDIPFVKDAFGRNDRNGIRVDSIYYSFAMDDPSVTSAVIKVPVNITGIATDRDRPYKVEVAADKTTATDTDWDRNTASSGVIGAGKLRDTLLVTVNRTEELKEVWKSIYLRMLPNEDFGLGYANLLEVKLSFSDIPAPPSWWSGWVYYFGEFQREKYLKWQEIYYEGVDPNVNKYGSPHDGEPLYWNNMPSSPIESWFPSTFMFIRMLKQYFIDNEVYPDGDTTKPRISLP